MKTYKEFMNEAKGTKVVTPDQLKKQVTSLYKKLQTSIVSNFKKKGIDLKKEKVGGRDSVPEFKTTTEYNGKQMRLKNSVIVHLQDSMISMNIHLENLTGWHTNELEFLANISLTVKHKSVLSLEEITDLIHTAAKEVGIFPYTTNSSWQGNDRKTITLTMHHDLPKLDLSLL